MPAQDHFKERWILRQHRQHRLPLSAAPAAASAGLDPLPRTVLTVLTVFSSDVRILITRFPARPSRLKAISMPSARRNVWVRRKCPARARGFLSQAARLLI